VLHLTGGTLHSHVQWRHWGDASRDAVTSIYYWAQFSSMWLPHNMVSSDHTVAPNGGITSVIFHQIQTASLDTLTHNLQPQDAVAVPQPVKWAGERMIHFFSLQSDNWKGNHILVL